MRCVVWLIVLWLAACAPAPAASQIVVRVSTPVAATPTPSRAVLAGNVADAALLPTATPVCAVSELPPGQHISSGCSYTQTETEAAGAMLCRIQRNSCAFAQLVTNRDANIAFSRHKPDPLSDEDAMMHPAMLLPLSRLSDLVTAEWGAEVRLLVTAAYDSLGEHDLLQTDPARKYSLHFEGRSIDLVTYPADAAKFPRLCALAVTAGFDWVHNEADHCHASIAAVSLCQVCSGSVP